MDLIEEETSDEVEEVDADLFEDIDVEEIDFEDVSADEALELLEATDDDSVLEGLLENEELQQGTVEVIEDDDEYIAATEFSPEQVLKTSTTIDPEILKRLQ